MTIEPAEYPLKIRVGQTYRKTLTWYAGGQIVAGALVGGTPVNLTGATAILRAKASSDSPAVFFELTTENGGITLGGAAGTISLLLTKAQTLALSKNGIYECRIIYSNGEADWLFFGPVTVIRGAVV